MSSPSNTATLEYVSFRDRFARSPVTMIADGPSPAGGAFCAAAAAAIVRTHTPTRRTPFGRILNADQPWLTVDDG